MGVYMDIESSILKIIEQGNVNKNLYFLPKIQLDRKTYLAVNKILENLGGKWNRKHKGHIFESDIFDRIDNVLLTGKVTDVQKEFQSFETPDGLAKRLVKTANIQPGESVLEPSAGRGAIAKHIKNCHCIELHTENEIYLQQNNFYMVGNDFFEFGHRYDVIIANPPFQKQNDILHITHMIGLANRCVVSVASQSIMWRTNKKTKDFRELVAENGGTIKTLPEDSFKSSGTKVNTCVVHIEKL